MTPQEIKAALHSFECHCTGQCEQEIAAHERASAARDEAESQRSRTPPEIHAKIMGEHHRKVDAHDRRIRSLARRHAAASEGLLLDSPDEREDALYARDHGKLHAAMTEAGRVRFTHERSGDPFPDDEPEESDDED